MAKKPKARTRAKTKARPKTTKPKAKKLKAKKLKAKKPKAKKLKAKKPKARKPRPELKAEKPKPSPAEIPAESDEEPLTISPEKVCFIIMKAREFDAKDEVSEPDPGSNPADDQDSAVLEDHADDPVVEELTSLINSLSEDEQIDLVALAWLGRDDYEAGDWPAVREDAANAHNQRTARYLLGIPQLGDFLEEGLALLGYSCEEFEIGRL